MSGGFLDYMYNKSFDELSSDSLRYAITYMEGLSYAQKVLEKTRNILDELEQFDEKINPLRPAWKALEWWLSGDWGEREFIKECERFEQDEN
jgi:hypothetical protein